MIAARPEIIKGTMTERGWSEMRLADELGLSLNTAKALVNGGAVGEKSIAAVIRAFPEFAFDDLFTVTPGGERLVEEAVT